MASKPAQVKQEQKLSKIPSEEQVGEYFEALGFPADVQKLLSENDKMAFTGSALLRAMRAGDKWEPSDVDVFILDDGFHDYDAWMTKFDRWAEKNHGPHTKDDNGVAYPRLVRCQNGTTEMVLISRRYKMPRCVLNIIHVMDPIPMDDRHDLKAMTITEYIEGAFDMDFLKNSFNGKKLCICDETSVLTGVSDRWSVPNSKSLPKIVYDARLERYAKRSTRYKARGFVIHGT